MVNKADWEIFEIQRFLADLFDRYQILNLFFHLFQKRRKLFKFTLHWSIFWHKITFKGEYIFKICHLPFISPFFPAILSQFLTCSAKIIVQQWTFQQIFQVLVILNFFLIFKSPLYISVHHFLRYFTSTKFKTTI